ncbi:MAG: SiaB family protein kinase [Bacteroidales bacterium]|nr:SiaB family protein kinase [Bacteroidales bacterium]
MSFDTISDLIHSLKEQMKLRKVRSGIYKKILTVMIESLENVIRYTEHFENNKYILENYPPELQISFDYDEYIIETANPILNDDIPELDEKLKLLNNLDKKEIKALYKNTITDGKFTEKGGAGLGIIEMAKIADNKIEYSFSAINEMFSYFIIRMIVKQFTASKSSETT